MDMSEQQMSFGGDVDSTADAAKMWGGMPEFEHANKLPWRSIKVHFQCAEDMKAFSKLVGQPLTVDTKSIWYPQATIETYADKRYVDES